MTVTVTTFWRDAMAAPSYRSQSAPDPCSNAPPGNHTKTASPPAATSVALGAQTDRYRQSSSMISGHVPGGRAQICWHPGLLSSEGRVSVHGRAASAAQNRCSSTGGLPYWMLREGGKC